LIEIRTFDSFFKLSELLEIKAGNTLFNLSDGRDTFK
jgi:hypothetical protein